MLSKNERQALNNLKITAMLNKGNHDPIPVATITRTYLIVQPLLDMFKKGNICIDRIQALYEFYMMASFICDHTQKQTVDSAQHLLQTRKRAVFDAGVVLLEHMRSISDTKTYRATGNDIKEVHAGYIAACDIFEASTMAAYTAARAEINSLEAQGAQRRRKTIIRKRKRRK